MGSIDPPPDTIRPTASARTTGASPSPASSAKSPPPSARVKRLWDSDPTVRIGAVVAAGTVLVLLGRWSARPSKTEIVRPAVSRSVTSGSVSSFANAPQAGAAVATESEAAALSAPTGEIASDIAAIDTQIRRAEAEDQRYSGGLVKALIGAEIRILHQTRAMLQQRASSWTFGIGLRYTVDGRPFVPPADASRQLAEVETEIVSTKSKLASADAEAARYSGGLVQALSVSTAATIRNSLAMLEQRQLALKYSLPQYIGFQGAHLSPEGAGPSATPVPEAPASAPSAPAKKWSIVEVDSRVTEQNDTWWRYAWKLTLRNDDSADAVFDATIEFQDGDGFVIDSAQEYRLAIPGGSDRTFTGFALVRTPGAARVARTNAKVAVH